MFSTMTRTTTASWRPRSCGKLLRETTWANCPPRASWRTCCFSTTRTRTVASTSTNSTWLLVSYTVSGHPFPLGFCFASLPVVSFCSQPHFRSSKWCNSIMWIDSIRE
ncbi:hypothetical protein CEXT_374351 [Caerostris extrusa]|uniref:Uncharacterized protein n=1 Tax=Caerostris extrusa TaxID=172846 RepID=A0AAV4WW99_CAEEX|nr:hypothetical protein CEXT_374351 [Caerostris extrusa]